VQDSDVRVALQAHLPQLRLPPRLFGPLTLPASGEVDQAYCY
jgi:hypothetical protein